MATTTKPNEPANATNKGSAAAASGTDTDDEPDFASWSKLQIGFAPYWHPEEGKHFFGEIIAKDARDPEFIRFQVRNLKKVETCRRGPNNDDSTRGATGESVTIPKGDSFSVSVYYSLAEEFEYQLYLARKLGQNVPMMVKALKTVKTSSNKECWTWEVRVSPQDRVLLDQHRDAFMALRSEGDAEPTRELEN